MSFLGIEQNFPIEMSSLFAAQKQGDDILEQYISLTDNEGSTALHLASQNGNEDVSRT